jgi:eukaryotic-like serine/threonine-protein kinase
MLVLSRYSVREQLGAGGMGIVYLARDEQLARDVAIKVLSLGTIADEAARKQFRKEALTLAKLNHPNIETVFDFVTEDGVDYLVTEYVPGLALDAKVAGGALPEKEVLRLGVQLAEGLEAAHTQGIVHCDLKPGNLRLTPGNRLKILDFGLARLASPIPDTAPTESLSRAPMGTMPYMAPEQLRGARPDHRSDIWAAGAVLYELATGKRPFPEMHTPNLIDSILHQSPSPPSAEHRQISPLLENIILKCLEKDPENRYQSVRELQVDLRRLSSGQSSNVVPPDGISRRWRPWAVAGGVAVLLILLAVIFWRERWPFGTRTHFDSLAVLPLENLSHDPEQEYLADGMTEALITDLGQIRGLRRVISHTSVLRYKTEREPLRNIAHQLKARCCVPGTPFKSQSDCSTPLRTRCFGRRATSGSCAICSRCSANSPLR